MKANNLTAQLVVAGFPLPVQELRFHPTRRWRFDLAWPDRLLAVEIEGGTFTMGRHVRPRGYERDCEKYNEAALMGWRVLRFTTRQIASGKALATIERALHSLSPNLLKGDASCRHSAVYSRASAALIWD